MERLRPANQEVSFPQDGTSLKDLLNSITKETIGHPRRTKTIRWLAENIETTVFWVNLEQHLLDDNTASRHSLGGIFSRESGQEQIQGKTWNHVHSSLDNFLKSFGLRATEFLFRDFQPQSNDPVLENQIKKTRELAMEKFPRLRKLYWDDYKEMLETTSFWIGINQDLQKLAKPVSINKFFNRERTMTTQKYHKPHTNLETAMINRFKQEGRGAQVLDYSNFSQIVRGTFHKDPRSFLLGYQSQSESLAFQNLIKGTKILLEKKILTKNPEREKMPRISLGELKETVHTDIFWKRLLSDLNRHFSSKYPVEHFNYFLRHYDSSSNEVMPCRTGSYADLCLALTKKEEGNTRSLIREPSKDFVNYLMWGFRPTPNLEKVVIDVKRLAAELFPQDCLYVELQDPEFWERFEKDILKTKRPMSFGLFLRYFNDENIGADRRTHKSGTAAYQIFLQRSYHKPGDIKSLCSYLKLPKSDNYKTNLQTLFFHLAPTPLKELLKTKFPIDFDAKAKIGKQKEVVIFDQTREQIKPLVKNPEGAIGIHFAKPENEKKVRRKIQSAARNLKLRIITFMPDNATIVVKVRKRKKLNKAEVAEMEKKVKELRDQKLANKQIAERLGLEDYSVEYIAGILIKKGEIQPRAKKSKNIP